MILTISIPMYNMEQYIKRCLNSVIVPDCEDLYEVLVMNDGSTDRSLSIAKQYECQYPKIIKVINKPNGNWGSCNNLALKMAKGKYFRVLDADDYFSVCDLRKFIHVISSMKDDVDIIETRCRVVYEDGKENNSNKYNVEYGKIFNLNDLVFFMAKYASCNPHCNV